MPLAPAPLFPGTSPLPPTGHRPPSPRATRTAAGLSLLVLLVALGLGSFVMQPLLFFAPMLQAQMGITRGGAEHLNFQGFIYTWTRRDATAVGTGGFNSQASLDNLKLQANVFHMNAVIIPVIADMPVRSVPLLAWKPGDTGNLDTLPDSDYEQVIKDARKVGLIPILQLTVQQQDPKSKGDESPIYDGYAWDNQTSHFTYYDYPYNSKTEQKYNAVQAEQLWFDQYTAFAAHFARMAEKFSLPYFIMGDQLSSITGDSSATAVRTDPNGIITIPSGEASNCNGGRRDCEWRHVINAIRNTGYTTLQNGSKPAPDGGGHYTGKLIYNASWDNEFERMTWWDALDYIGIAAYFPLARDRSGVPPEELQNIWHGIGNGTGGGGDIYGRLQKVSDKYFKPVIFTSAGYESAAGASGDPGHSSKNDPDQDEQLNDMEALNDTFQHAGWWLGVFWNGEMPAPHNSQPNWATSMNWAGDTLGSSKVAGQWLAQTYQHNPLPCTC